MVEISNQSDCIIKNPWSEIKRYARKRILDKCEGWTETPSSGLQSGITRHLSDSSKILIFLDMYFYAETEKKESIWVSLFSGAVGFHVFIFLLMFCQTDWKIKSTRKVRLHE